MHGDCLQLLKEIPDNSIDLCLTDPPYGTTACKWDSVIPFEPMWAELKRIVKDNGAICLFGSEPFSSHLRLSNIKMFKYDWIWIKERGTGIGNARKMPMKKNEIISTFYLKPPHYDYRGDILDKPYKHVLPKTENGSSCLSGAKSIGQTENRKYHYYTHKTKTNIISIARENNRKSVHPTQKPVALLEYLIETYTRDGETVLDFTMGSGSTGVAAKNLNRSFIGIEQDDKYFEIAKERIEKTDKGVGNED